MSSHLVGCEGVQAGRRLVQEQQPRVVRHQAEPDVDPLCLPACGGQSVSLSNLPRKPASGAMLAAAAERRGVCSCKPLTLTLTLISSLTLNLTLTRERHSVIASA